MVRRNTAASSAAWRKRSLVAAVMCISAALGACGGGDEETAAVQAPVNPPSGNQAPTISGTPPAQTMQDQQYTFTPTASDANGDTLTFSITNKPAWATFTASSGVLSGTPTAGQVATYSNIQISVSDGTTTTSLPAFSITVVATATGSATLTWNPPTQNTDGSTLNNLAGYKVYWGTSQGNYTNSVTVNSPGLATYVVDQLTPATWYFAVSAINTVGVESALSNVASKQVL
jgi:hypothetical protein